MPSMNDTPLSIKQTLDTDEINFINWELNVQDVASTSGRKIAGDQGILGLVLNTAQWESHALNISVNDEGHQFIAPGTRRQYVGNGNRHYQSEKQNSRGLDDRRTEP